MRILQFILSFSQSLAGFRIFASLLFFSFSLHAYSVTLDCPEDYTVALAPGECEIEIYYDSLSFSSTVDLIDTVFFPFPGTMLPTGITVVTLSTTDIYGNLEQCIFSVTVLASYASQIDCLPQNSISLQGQCSRLLDAGDVLAPGFDPCPGDFLVQRIDENDTLVSEFITAFDIDQPFTAQLTHLSTGTTCTSILTVTGGAPPSITCPNGITLRCNIPLEPEFTGSPELSGCYTEDVILNYTDDTEITFCPDSIAYQIVRTWTSTDPFGRQNHCNQLITGMRFDPTTVIFPGDFDGTHQSPLSCSDSLGWSGVADPAVTGIPIYLGFPAGGGLNCKVAVSYLDFETQICGASYEIKRVWKVVKACPPSITLLDTQLIRVVDVIAPQFKLPDTIFVSLSSDCADSLFMPSAEIISECSDFEITIETPWDTLHTNGGYVYYDSIIGEYPVRYILKDACDNQAVKNVKLLIEDKTLAACPPDDTISCNLYFDSLITAFASGNNELVSQYLGNPTIHSNCSYQFAESDTLSVNSCGIGHIKRKIYNLAADDPFSCIQSIAVVHISDFEVLFPNDTSICTEPAATNTGSPIIFEKDCEKTTTSFQDQIIQSGFPGCYTIQRKWSVINSCIFDPNIELPDEEVGLRRFKDGGDGFIQFTQLIEVNTSTPTFPNGCSMPNIFLDADACLAQVEVPSPPVLSCNNPTMSVEGDLGNLIGATKELEVGVYELVFQASDDCGHIAVCTANFEVFDTIFPEADCKTSIVVELSAGGLAVLSAQQLDAYSHDNCGNLTFSFLPDTISNTHSYSCDDLCIPAETLTLWVTDPSGNQDYCEALVLVQNPFGSCPNCDIALSGKISTENNTPISGVEVMVTAPGFSQTTSSTLDGEYQVNAPSGGDYTIKPFKNGGNILEGITTFDLVLIQRHILGIQSLGSPYKIIAADVNKSDSVTTYDIVLLRKLILLINTDFGLNTSWRFVPKNYIFPNPNNPFFATFPEFILKNDVFIDTPNQDFIGIKTGNVN